MGLILVQTVRRAYQQTTKIATGREIVNKELQLLMVCFDSEHTWSYRFVKNVVSARTTNNS